MGGGAVTQGKGNYKHKYVLRQILSASPPGKHLPVKFQQKTSPLNIHYEKRIPNSFLCAFLKKVTTYIREFMVGGT